MISLDDFYINYKLILEKVIKLMISDSLDEAKAYADDILTSLYNDRGTWNASGDTFPSSGGSGPSGTIRKGDTWTIIAEGSPDGLLLEVGDIIRAFVDNPTQNQADWVFVENQYGYIPFNQTGDTLTGINGNGFLGLLKQATNPSTPVDGIKLFSNSAGHLTFINEAGQIKDIDSILDLLGKHIDGLLLVDMLDDDKLLTAGESKNSCFILTNVGDGSKTLTLTDGVENPTQLTFYVFDNSPVNVSACSGGFVKTIKPQTPLQVIYTPTQAYSLNYVTFNNLMTPGWATKVHFNEFGLIDNTSTISTADVPDSLNKRYVTEAEKQTIQDFIAAGGDAVPPTRMINGHTLETDIVLVPADLGLGNVNNTSDLNKPISTATQTALNLKEDKSQKGANNGYAPLDGTGKVPLVNLPSALANTLHQQFYEITPTDVLNKFITLEYIPTNPLKVDVVIYGGIHQRALVDFLVVGNVLSWDGLALESLIEANHYLNITYSH